MADEEQLMLLAGQKPYSGVPVRDRRDMRDTQDRTRRLSYHNDQWTADIIVWVAKVSQKSAIYLLCPRVTIIN